VLLSLAVPLTAIAQDVGLRIDALLQEAELLREELSRLDAAGAPLVQEGQRLDAAESALRTDSDTLNQDIESYNVGMKDLEQAAAGHAARCPRQSEDAALVESCNAEAGKIQAEAQRMEATRPQLEQRRKELNQRVALQNAARRDWAARQHVHDNKVGMNRRDLNDWLRRAQAFIGSADFRAAVSRAGNPPSCAQAPLRDLEAKDAAGAIDLVRTCLRALQGTR
jgi:chromosome segregation ATPase